MWTRRNYFIWFELSKDKGRLISLPISLIAIKALFESLFELIIVVSYFIPGTQIKDAKKKDTVTFAQLRKIIEVIEQMMMILEHQHHLDFVEIDNKDVHFKLVLR